MMTRILAVLAIASAGLYAQSTSGTLVGTVRDSTGAVVSGATVRVTNAGTGAALETKSNENGDYVAPNLSPSVYRIHAEHPGFRAVDVNQITLLTSQTIRNDIRLEPGDLQQIVQVEASAPVVTSESSSIANNVDAHTVVTLPLNGRTLDR
ncbi:MAG: carboxypeptidase-like regulatory domain-containing protein, partial [Saprospiraceae bacterium]